MPCYSHSQVQAMCRSVGFPDVAVNTKWGSVPLLALISAIATQESNRCDEPTGTIAKGERSIGVFQINSTVHKKFSVSQLRDFRTNTQEALRIYKSQGLRAWGAYVDGKAKKYLPAALAAYKGKAEIAPAPTGNNNNTNSGSVISKLPALTNDTTSITILAGVGVAVLLFLLKKR